MSNAGFQLFGSNGNIQLDIANKPLVLAQKGTILVTDGSRPSGYSGPIPSIGYTATLAYANSATTHPILVLQCSQAYIGIMSGARDASGTYNWGLKGVDPTGATTSWTVNYWVFDAITMSETHSGLNLYDASGNVIYSSDYKPLRIVGIADSPNTYLWNDATSTPNGGSMTAPSGNYGAFLAGARFHHTASGSAVITANYKEGIKTSSTGMSTSAVFLINNLSSSVYKSTSSKMFLVNVAGY